MLERIYHMLIKEFLQIFRDPKMRSIILLVPIIQSLLFGYAVTTDVHHVKTAVYDLDNTEESRNLIQAVVQSGHFDIVQYLHDDTEIAALIDNNDVALVIQINRGFQGDINAGKTAVVQAIIDGIDSNTASIIESYLTRIVSKQSSLILKELIAKKKGTQLVHAGINLETRAWFNDNLESRNFFIPGVIATLLTLVTLTLTSMSIVREKEIGTIEQMMVTPIKKVEFILGKTVPFIIIGFIDVIAILIVAIFWFEVPIHGSLALLFAAICLYLLTTLGIGFFISTISETQQQALMSAFLFYFPAVLLSGFIFPIANMPLLIQWLTYINPLKYFLIIVRGIFLKGVGLEILWPQMIILGMMGFFTLSLATKRFSKTLT